MSDYIEEQLFPNGLFVDYYSQFGEEYRSDLVKVTDDQDFAAFRKKWGDLFPEMEVDVPLSDLIRIREDHAEQDKIVTEDSKGDRTAQALMNYLVPPTLLLIILNALKFQVSHGLVLLQLFNGGNIDVLEDGKWRLKRELFPKITPSPENPQ